MNTEPDISIVIVSYNVWAYLKPCIGSILRQKNIVPEVIVVDNNSFDGTIDKIREHFQHVKIIRNTKNVGFSAANNMGIKEAKGKLILLLNPDTELKEENTLAQMRDFMIDNQGVGILAPMLLNTDGSLQLSCWNFPRVTYLLKELFYLHIKEPVAQNKPIEVETASGAALCFNRNIPDAIGGLDENLFWMEDIDYCYRVHKTGNKIVYNPDIRIIHHGGKSTTGNYSISIPNQVISKVKYFKKHGTGLQYSMQNILSLLFILSRLVVFAIISLSGKSLFRQKLKAYWVALKAYLGYNFGGNKAIIN